MQIECSGTSSSCATVPDALLPDCSRMLVYWHSSLCACHKLSGHAGLQAGSASAKYGVPMNASGICTFYAHFFLLFIFFFIFMHIFLHIFVMAYFMHNLCIEPDSEKHRENNKSPCSTRAAVRRRCGESQPSLHWKGLLFFAR